ncbi:hypothetical protein BHM03_00061346 [Ensete ventricosum]|nr:hypothetical protein BHM03_00061346 [Ensete ventricosum]
MILNNVESFYMFLLRFHSESSEEMGRLAMAKPFARAADYDHIPSKGGRPRPAPLQGWSAATKAAGKTAGKRRHSHPRPGRKGRLPAAHLQGAVVNGQLARAADRKGSPPPAYGREEGGYCENVWMGPTVGGQMWEIAGAKSMAEEMVVVGLSSQLRKRETVTGKEQRWDRDGSERLWR